MLLPGENEAVAQALAAGAKYGYGNMIAHLKREWARTLMSRYGMTKAAALHAADTSAYPVEAETESSRLHDKAMCAAFARG